jgi:hypothetical protein
MTRAPREPIRLHPDNGHYFLFRGRPTVLITSGEHYGAVLNLDFDYRKYLATLQKLGFNLTRTFSGCYCEPVGAFNIQQNTLAPARGRLICPWARSSVPGYANGGSKFDLTRWDTAYFQRLKDFVGQAGKRAVVVELVLFCPFYKDAMWDLSPMNAANNVNGVGAGVQRTSVYTLRSGKLQAVQDAMVRRVVQELKDFDNLYYEICNEPYFGGVSLAWQHHVADTIVEAEKPFRHKHLIAQNIANGSKKVVKPHPAVSIFNFHYARPPVAVAMNYALNKAIGDDETGFQGMGDAPYRTEGWDFIVAGGAVYDNLDYSFTCGHEDGTCRNNAPGGGGASLHRQLGILVKFIHGFDFIRMRPDDSVIRAGAGGAGAAVRRLRPGRQPRRAGPATACRRVPGRMGEYEDRPRRQARDVPPRRRRPDARLPAVRGGHRPANRPWGQAVGPPEGGNPGGFFPGRPGIPDVKSLLIPCDIGVKILRSLDASRRRGWRSGQERRQREPTEARQERCSRDGKEEDPRGGDRLRRDRSAPASA